LSSFVIFFCRLDGDFFIASLARRSRRPEGVAQARNKVLERSERFLYYFCEGKRYLFFVKIRGFEVAKAIPLPLRLHPLPRSEKLNLLICQTLWYLRFSFKSSLSLIKFINFQCFQAPNQYQLLTGKFNFKNLGIICIKKWILEFVESRNSVFGRTVPLNEKFTFGVPGEGLLRAEGGPRHSESSTP